MNVRHPETNKRIMSERIVRLAEKELARVVKHLENLEVLKISNNETAKIKDLIHIIKELG